VTRADSSVDATVTYLVRTRAPIDGRRRAKVPADGALNMQIRFDRS
jgi:hypothetical protein